MKSEEHLVIKNLSFVTSGTGVLSLPTTWKISQNLKFSMNMRSFCNFHSLYVTVWQQTPDHIFKTSSKSLGLAENLVFNQKKYVVKKNSGIDRTLKVAKNLWFWFFWLIIWSSEESPATDAWVQFRVITFFKLLHRKGFYTANVPEVTQKKLANQSLLNHKISKLYSVQLRYKEKN